MLSSLIRLPTSPTTPTDDPEDIFTSALGLVFTDDTLNQHGNPGASVIYKSTTHGDIELSLVDPGSEESRKLFAQYLWNAGVWMAECIGGRAVGVDMDVGEGVGVGVGEGGGLRDGNEDGAGEKRGRVVRGEWSVKGEKVLELGAGTGLGGIISTLAGAQEVTISDYPAPEILANMTQNVSKNIPAPDRCKVQVTGHEWGVLSDSLATSHAHYYTRILASDCLWMPWQHRNLAKSMAHFLSREPHARVWVIAGFHTGRAKVAGFFEGLGVEGLEVEDLWERDVDGCEREWVTEREGEDVTGRKRWVVVAILRRKGMS